MQLVFLGKLSDLAPAGLGEIARPGEVRTLADLMVWIARSWPELGCAMQAVPLRVVVNHRLAPDVSAPLQDGDEIAFLPPMSGG